MLVMALEHPRVRSHAGVWDRWAGQARDEIVRKNTTKRFL